MIPRGPFFLWAVGFLGVAFWFKYSAAASEPKMFMFLILSWICIVGDRIIVEIWRRK